MLEADFPWRNACCERGLHHKKPDQVVRQQMDPDLLVHHFGRLAAEDVHPHSLLDMANIQLHVPALFVECFHIRFADPLVTRHRGHHDLATGFELTHGDRFRRPLTGRLTHPVRLELWLFDFNQVVALPQPFAATKVSDTFSATQWQGFLCVGGISPCVQAVAFQPPQAADRWSAD